MCPGQACEGAAWGGELPLARVVRDCAPESGVVFIYMTRLARTHNKTRALQCDPPPLRGKSSTVHRPRRPRVSQHQCKGEFPFKDHRSKLRANCQ